MVFLADKLKTVGTDLVFFTLIIIPVIALLSNLIFAKEFSFNICVELSPLSALLMLYFITYTAQPIIREKLVKASYLGMF